MAPHTHCMYCSNAIGHCNMKSKIYLWITTLLIGIPVFLLFRGVGYEKAYGYASIYETVFYTLVIIAPLITGAFSVNKQNRLNFIIRLLSAAWLTVLLIYSNQTWMFSTSKMLNYFLSGKFIENPLGIIVTIPILLFYIAIFVILRNDIGKCIKRISKNDS